MVKKTVSIKVGCKTYNVSLLQPAALFVGALKRTCFGERCFIDCFCLGFLFFAKNKGAEKENFGIDI